MTVIALPNRPGPAEIDWGVIDFGGIQSGPLGGKDQRVNRLGKRWQLEVIMGSMTPELAEAWAVVLTQGLETGVSMRVREPDTPAGSPGPVLVNGAGQAGGALVVKNGTRGHFIRQGKWFSILTGGRRYLHKVASPVRLSDTGTGTIPLAPLLRVSPANDAPVELAVPIIEGNLILPPRWKISRSRIEEGFTFGIREAE